MHPTPTLPLTQALAKKRAATPALSDYPALALAASTLSGEPREMDICSPEFCETMACLETLNRLQLGSRNAHALGLLVKQPTRASDLAASLRLTAAGTSVVLRRLEALALITTNHHHGDRREVIATTTQAGRNVMAALVALTALGQVSAVLLNPKPAKL